MIVNNITKYIFFFHIFCMKRQKTIVFGHFILFFFILLYTICKLFINYAMQGGYIMKTTLLYLFIYIIEALILWSYSSNLFHSRYSKKIEFIGLFTGYGFLFLLAFIKVVWINLLFFQLINFIFFIIFITSFTALF